MPCDSGPGAADLWAMAAELERQFAGYKQRLAERTTTTGATTTAREHAVDDEGGWDGAEEEEDEAGVDGRCGGGDVRGRMYEAYVRRRDERLRDGWHARMERKEAEVKALWAKLELSAGRGGGGAERAAPAGGDTTTTTTTATDGDDERKTERDDDDRRRSSSDAALAPRRITGKKHARTRSFSSSITTSRNRADVGRRRSLSQEPPPSEPDASSEEAKKKSPGGAAATTTATTRPRTSLRRRNSSTKGHGSAKQAASGPKLPRSLPRRPSSSSGGPEDLGRGAEPAVVQPSADAVAPPVPSHSAEYAAPSGTPRDSPPRMSFAGRDDDSGVGTGAANARATSPEPDRSSVDEAVPHGEPEAKNAGVEGHDEEKVDADGEVTSDSEPEPSYVYINKDAAEEQAMAALPEPSKLASSDAALDSDVKASEQTPAAPAPAEATAAAAEIATTNAEEAPARESSDESTLSVRSSGPSARPSCSSRDQSIERLLEADAVLVRKKREERAEKRAAPAPRTPPGSAGSRFSGTARSPRETTVRGFKRFLSFGKKHKGREATVIDCTSPSVPSPADDDSGSASGRWQPAGGCIKPRMGSSDATSDDTDHGYPQSPQACSLQSLVAASPAKSELAEIVPQEKSPKVHRSFFSFRSLNCGRG
ncbi:serine/arginine repetitive matrix protein 1 isoform X2 [Sorghum bicolor]|uniref:serine/arginine repetitive matrix protein 1 isoform X2 n=1 Tax=Sorghum bicolor TaxID=4558 RepID=UPI000B424BD2|nr:serine/arginine repetitive matrix protein 1 isoform X2 [Sorghum bicolor]|eukprot:XP_021313891.1 serine/arginine repetitive matrix protein 1 isoform X2 [Sorghum bicolor]